MTKQEAGHVLKSFTEIHDAYVNQKVGTIGMFRRYMVAIRILEKAAK